MSTLSVGPGQTYATIDAAVDASQAGDTIAVQAGTYTNAWLQIDPDLNLVAVGGWVRMVTDNAQPPDGKAMITESGTVSISGFDISGVTVPDQNGAAIRYQGGALTLDNVFIHDNQEGILGAADSNGSITVNRSEFAFNGDGSGHTHGIYVGAIANFTLANSYIHDTAVGHEVKSRAANNVITGNRIFDNNGSASYSIDLPNAGNATVANNVIQQGPNTQNPAIIAYGEEGASNGAGTVSIRDNTFVNDDPGGYLLLNPGGFSVGVTANDVFGLTSGGTILTDRPVLDLSPIAFLGSSPPPPPDPTPTLTPLEQYHADVLADFTVWAATHIKLATMSKTLAVLNTELNSTTVIGIIRGDKWSQ
jgi:hypothetical protein